MLTVEADDPAAEEDIKRCAKRIGHEIMKFEKEGMFLTFYIRKMPNQGIQPKLNTCGWCLSLVVQIKS